MTDHLPKRYRFDNPVPAFEPVPLPDQQQDLPAPMVVHQHIHQAPPDRTVQRVALGAGMGAGTVAAGVYFGPLLVATLASMAASLAVLAIVAVAAGWAVVSVVRAVDGHQDAKAARKSPTRKGR